jgi:DNA-nicking Smr family endonuclease
MNAGPKGGQGGKRRLSKEELALWLQVTRTIKPRSGAKEPDVSATVQSEAKAQPSAPDAPAIDVHAKPTKGAYRPQALPLAPIERRLRQRLSRGQISIDLKIDLHGMRQDEAHSALRQFLARARHSEAKVVLVVTGKGSGKARADAGGWSEGGVLRRTVPQWLSAPELRHVVLGFEEAAQTHGGSGALYVRLRGRRASAGLQT